MTETIIEQSISRIINDRADAEKEFGGKLLITVAQLDSSDELLKIFKDFLQDECGFHKDASEKLRSTASCQETNCDRLLAFAKHIEDQCNHKLKSISTLRSEMKNIPITNGAKSVVPFKLKPPDSKPPDTSKSLGWIRTRKNKSSKKSSKNRSKTTQPSVDAVDEEGYSIRPPDEQDDSASFYSSSDDDDDEPGQKIRFKINPAIVNSSNGSKPSSRGASTEELRETAFNLIIPDKPLAAVRKRGMNRDEAKGSSSSIANVEFNDMLGINTMKNSDSVRSLHSDLSNVDTSDADSLPPPAQPPPRVRESPLSQKEPPIPQRVSSLSGSKPACLNPSRAAPTPPVNELSPNQPTAPIPVIMPSKAPSPRRRPLPPKPDPSEFGRPQPPALPPRLPPKQDVFDMPFNSSFDKSSRRRSSCSSTSNSVVINSLRGPSPILSTDGADQTLPLGFSFHERVNAVIKSADINSSVVKITGTISLSCPSGTADKIGRLGLGDIFFELTNSATLLDSNQIYINKQLVGKRDQEAVGDQTIYTIEADSLVEHLRSKSSSSAFHTIELIKYQIQLDPESENCEESMHFVPLQIMSYSGSTQHNLNVKIEYMYNEGAFPKGTNPVLNDTTIMARLKTDRDVSGITSDPSAHWDSQSKRAIWQLGPLSPGSVGSGTGVLKAKFSYTADEDGVISPHPDSPVEVGAQFSCEGTVTGIGILLLSPDYRLSVLQYKTVSGQYISQSV